MLSRYALKRNTRGRGLLIMSGAVVAALAILMVGYFGAIRPGTDAAAGPKLQIKNSPNGQVGQPIQFEIRIINALDIAGYEANLRYDHDRAIFRGVSHEDKSLDRLQGIDPQPLGPIEVPSGVVFGLFTCPVNVCSEADAAPGAASGGRGNIHLATFEFVPTATGTLELSFDSLKFVDFYGEQVIVEIPSRTITVDVRE